MTPLALAILAFAGLALLFVGFMLLRLSARGSAADPRLPALQAERDRLAAELAQAGARAREDGEALGRLRAAVEASREASAAHAELRSTADALRESLSAEKAAHATAARELDERKRELAALREAQAALQAEAQRVGEALAQAQANLSHAHRAEAEMRAFIEEAQAKLSASFAQMAGKVFAERGAQFEQNVRTATTQSKADIETLLKPFATQLDQFRQRVDTVYGEEAKERAALAGAVDQLRTLNQDMALQAAALTRALKGSAKVRGDWGELMLDNVLRGCGLEEGQHYERQKGGIDEEGRMLRPDVVVRLPDDRRIVIDSKVNLVAWQEAMNADSPEVQHDAMRRHSVALRQHVRDLAERDYPRAIGDSALDTTVLFVPIEGALSAALGADETLQTFAFERRIVFASPNTLMAVLRVVDRVWARDKLQKQAQRIGDAGGKLLDALSAFLAEFDAVGSRIEDAGKAFRKTRDRLSESPQAVLPRARRLAELGARGKRRLHDELVPEIEEFPALDAAGAPGAGEAATR